VNPDITVRHCRGIAEMTACVDAQRRVWGEVDLEVIPATCFIVAEHSGGQVLGAFDGSKMVGFTLATPAIRDRQTYLHSQMTAVLENYRDQNIGRRLKLFQREDALARGIRLIEWTFDPLETRNAHFNLDRLGAIARKLVRNMYGITSSPLHRGLPTDRLVAEWHLDSPRVVDLVAGRAPSLPGSTAEVVLLQDIDAFKADCRDQISRIQANFSSTLEECFKRGYAATGTSRSPEGFQYLLQPWSQN
jgi:predicted GNAT superfamily acetyltransferase